MEQSESKQTEHAVKKARSTGKAKTSAVEDYTLQFNLAESPHIKEMSPGWQRLYAAVSAAVKKH